MTTILMCPPDYFTVDYVINPWMAGNEESMSLDKGEAAMAAVCATGSASSLTWSR